MLQWHGELVIYKEAGRINKLANIAVKTLSEVEVNSWASNQHEFNGVTQLRELLGADKQSFSAHFYYLSNAGIKDRETGSLTWYDARENHPYRTGFIMMRLCHHGGPMQGTLC